MAEVSYDLIVLGAGMAGMNAARKCARAGWSVAIVDHRRYGGTCALRGCDPKKILRRGAEITDAAKALAGRGFDPGNAHIRWRELRDWKTAYTEKMSDDIEQSLERAGVSRLHGLARFEGPDKVRLDDRRLTAEHFVVATGARPRPLDIPGADVVIDSTAFMELEALPPRIVFLGGGYVSMEFAHMAARAGSEVTIIERGKRILKGFDEDLTERLTGRSRDVGIDFRFDTEVTGIEQRGDEFTLLTGADDDAPAITCDLVVHGAGRVPNVEHLELDAAGISATDAGITVNDYLQSTSNDSVYAAGDVVDTQGLPLTPVAVDEGSVAASNLIEGNQRKPDYRGTPSVAFTIPEIARVGMSEQEARECGDVRVSFNDCSDWYSQRRVGETHSAAKIITDERTDRILGAHLLGHGYGEVANLFALALRSGLKASDLRDFRSAYPTACSDVEAML